MRFWWYDDPPNFGDVLTPIILRHFGVPFTQCERANAQAIMVGSIAKWARTGVSVYGSGFIDESDPVCHDANWLWVRGPDTARKIIDAGGNVGGVFGDPAWLLPMIYKAEPKIHDVGIAPHYVDIPEAEAAYPGYPIINLLDPPEKVSREISQCRAIISSSLHGLIAAHAYGVPAAWVKLSDKLCGDGFKFRDHYASMGMQAVLSPVDDPVFDCGYVNTKPMLEVLRR